MSKQIKHFNVRVYGIIINKNNEVLLADEYQLGMKMTKFPGGGLKFGEGTVDCLKREALEEFGQEVEVLEHFYTLEYFQPSLFYEDHQLLSIYYKARFIKPIKFKIYDKPFGRPGELKNGYISFRWKDLEELTKEDVSLPVDKKVTKRLIKQMGTANKNKA